MMINCSRFYLQVATLLVYDITPDSQVLVTFLLVARIAGRVFGINEAVKIL